MRIKLLIIIFFVGLVGILWYIKQGSTNTEPVGQVQVGNLTPSLSLTSTPAELIARNKNTDACASLSDAAFRSVHQFEVGLGTDDQEAMGYWDIRFQNTLNGYKPEKPLVSWHHSDVVESGTYACLNNTITVTFSYDMLIATYNPITSILTWQDIEYKRL